MGLPGGGRLKRYLITGGLGFIGAQLACRLVRDGNRVRVLDVGSRGHVRRLGTFVNDVEILMADVRDSAAVERATRSVDVVLHLAAVNGTAFFYSDPARVLDVAIRGTLNVLDSCRLNSVEQMILASSSEVYHQAATVPTGEQVPLVIPDVHNPRYSYSGGKIAAELLTIHCGAPCKALIVRPHNVYGPDMGLEHVIPQLIMKAYSAASSKGSRLLLQGDGSQTRAFMHIVDFVEAMMLLLAKGEHRGVYHVGTTDEVSVRDLASLVVKELGVDLELEFGSSPAGEPSRRCPDTAKLRLLGFAPAVALRDGLREVANWYLQNRELWPVHWRTK